MGCNLTGAIPVSVPFPPPRTVSLLTPCIPIGSLLGTSYRPPGPVTVNLLTDQYDGFPGQYHTFPVRVCFPGPCILLTSVSLVMIAFLRLRESGRKRLSMQKRQPGDHSMIPGLREPIIRLRFQAVARPARPSAGPQNRPAPTAAIPSICRPWLLPPKWPALGRRGPR